MEAIRHPGIRRLYQEAVCPFPVPETISSINTSIRLIISSSPASTMPCEIKIPSSPAPAQPVMPDTDQVAALSTRSPAQERCAPATTFIPDSQPRADTPFFAQLPGSHLVEYLDDESHDSYDPYHPPPYDKGNNIVNVDVDHLVNDLWEQNCADRRGFVLVELAELPPSARNSTTLINLGRAGFMPSKYGTIQGWVAVTELGELTNKLGRIVVLPTRSEAGA